MMAFLLLILAATGNDPAPFRLVDQARHERYVGMLPPVDDPKVAQLFQSPDWVFYTDKEMEPCYQNVVRGGLVVLAVSYDLSGGADRKKRPDGRGRGNANLEFPWQHPFGTDGYKDLGGTVRRFRLPRKATGEFWPVIYWLEDRAASAQSMRLTSAGLRFETTEPVWVWMFPHGAAFMEIISTQTGYTREVRLRSRDESGWQPNVFEPNSFEVLYPSVKALKADHPMPSFSEAVHRLAMPLDDTMLRNATFRQALAAEDPTTSIEVSRKSCMRCHDGTLRLAAEFETGRDWYGRVRGSDGIFSWHPFDKSSISHNGNGRTVQMRKDFVAAGIVQRYDPMKHPKEIYSRIPDMKPRTPWAKEN